MISPKKSGVLISAKKKLKSTSSEFWITRISARSAKKPAP